MPGVVEQVLRYKGTRVEGSKVLLVLVDTTNLHIVTHRPHYPSLAWKLDPDYWPKEVQIVIRAGDDAYISQEIVIGKPLTVYIGNSWRGDHHSAINFASVAAIIPVKD